MMATRAKKKPRAWQRLAERLAAASETPGLDYEFYMPIALSDEAGAVAWSAYADTFGARFCPLGHERRDPANRGVAWDMPPDKWMRPALSEAKKMLGACASADNVAPARGRRMLTRVIADLESYRDVGCSSMSPDLPKGAKASSKTKQKRRTP